MKKRKNSKAIKEQRLAIKMFICLLYLILITVLFVYSYKLYQEKKDMIPWSQVQTNNDYSYIDIYKMSEKFAFYEERNVGIHFVIEKEDTGIWHTYIIAINENDYNKYKDIIDYTYERTDKIPKKVRVYGYPVIASNEIRDLAIKNISNFVPSENEIKITDDNYDIYLTNSYLDTTKSKKVHFNPALSILIFLLITTVFLFVLTVFDKDKIVDNLDEELDKTKRLLKIKE
jgi:hypothetical protein